MLQQHGPLLGNAAGSTDFLDLLRAHHQMTHKLSGGGIVGDQAGLRHLKLLDLGKIVEKGSCQQQIPIQEIPVLCRQEQGGFHHVDSVH